MQTASVRLARLAGVMAILAAGLPGLAFAGSGNQLYLLQTGGTGPGSGNSFLSDQTQAHNSSIGTEYAPALQLGDGNNADLSIEGDCLRASNRCGHIALVQNNAAASAMGLSPLSGNSATVNLSDASSASISQLGDGNQTTVTVSGGGTGAIDQVGLDNLATLTLSGGLDGTINQLGSENVAALAATGGPRASVTLNQIGSGASYSSGGAPITVSTNRPVTITQFHF